MAHDADNLTDVPPTAYQPGDRLARARVWLPAIAVLGVVGLGVIEFAARGQVYYTPGSLAAVHAALDGQCSKCHLDAQPLGGNNWLAALTGQTHAADRQCRTCHAAPDHHASAAPDDVPGCATCHREHQGRQAAMTRVADSLCTRCHADLDNHYRDGVTPSVSSVVTAFNRREHPPFRELKDPGTVAFNHQLHLSAGLSKVPDPALPLTLARIPPAFRAQYQRWARPDGAIQLDCAACHQPAGSDGALMQPIVYERHCQACHPLTIDRGVTVRHRVQPGELEQVVRGYYTAQFLKGNLAIDPGFLKQPLPGKNPLRPDDRQTARKLIEQHVAADTSLLLGPSTCAVPPIAGPGSPPRTAGQHPARLVPACADSVTPPTARPPAATATPAPRHRKRTPTCCCRASTRASNATRRHTR